MTRMIIALIWASAMLLLAAASKLGWVAFDTASFLLMVMPLLAVVSMQRGGRCRSAARNA